MWGEQGACGGNKEFAKKNCMQNIRPSYSPSYCTLSICLTSNLDSVYPHGPGTTLSLLILGLPLAMLFLLLSLLRSVFITSTELLLHSHSWNTHESIFEISSKNTNHHMREPSYPWYGHGYSSLPETATPPTGYRCIFTRRFLLGAQWGLSTRGKGIFALPLTSRLLF